MLPQRILQVRTSGISYSRQFIISSNTSCWCSPLRSCLAPGVVTTRSRTMTTPSTSEIRCVEGAAFDSIQEAVDNCPEGGSIIDPGLYDEDIDINKSISISGPDTTT